MKDYYYREYLENLVQERTLISSSVRFSIDDCNSVIDNSHRAGVMRIVLRSVFCAVFLFQI